MKILGSVVLVFCLVSLHAAQDDAAGMRNARRPKSESLMLGLGNLHHPVSTSNAQAQQFFDQGLRLIYAFNHDEAARSFQRAAELDPKLAMAYWGVAEAVGPNYNDPGSEDRFKQAHDAIQKALDLSASSSPSEQAYINAMAKRFPADPKSDIKTAAEQYRDAMHQVMKKYPDDLDAATLFAESGMNLHPWGLWHHDGTPVEGTDEIIATLESVIKRDPNHLGAVHYYIHAVEASPSPERALAEANRLAALAPSAGHIVHMPAHVYIRTGDYAAAVRTNEAAARADEAYIRATGAKGIYPGMYYSHNLHFIAIAASMDGDFAEAKQAASRLVNQVQPLLHDMPMLEGFMTIPTAVLVRFEKWDDVLKSPQPDVNLKTAGVFWHYARGMALAATGKTAEAEKEHQLIVDAKNATPEDVIFAPPFNNKTKSILRIADDVLAAKIAMARRDMAAAIARLQDGVAVQDSLNYGEPPDWYFPVRESLGATLLLSGDAAAAERVFREDLDHNPRNPRSLFGLRESLRKQGRNYDAGFVENQFRTAWKGDTSLKLEDLV
jgi:tetratricopeptide (TPR) repeat protein